ncbi:MAG TPA: 2OG-Fe(II) oxygenase [Azospirillaceae bacterium]|nr:2OG-Fe(II) oxygenase [Azospirillaceae bacterium]
MSENHSQVLTAMTASPAARSAQPATFAGPTIDIGAFRSTPLIPEPFDHLIVPGFIRTEAREAINRDWPAIDKPGSFPLHGLRSGPAFDALIRDLEGPELAAAFSEKFGMDLTRHPTMITVRGMARARDGQIHLDSRTKLITVLIYMNAGWEHPGGRLRLLRSGDNLDDMVAEVPPHEGTLLAFRNTPNAWHGHAPVEGPRRAIQLNWVTDAGVVWREQTRHRLSATLKRLNPFA